MIKVKNSAEMLDAAINNKDEVIILSEGKPRRGMSELGIKISDALGREAV